MTTVEAALASLQAAGGLAAAVSVYNAEAAHDGNPIAVPAAYYKGQSDNLAAGGFPSVEVYIGHGDLTRFPQGYGEADSLDRIVVIVTDEHGTGDVETLYEKIVGLGEATIQVLVVPDAFGPQVEVESVSYDYALVQQSDPSDPMSRDVQGYRTSAVLEFRVAGVVAFG
ncbi:MAG: hypothetical protein M3540_07320 [Actinomycetota bacterium]|nr:hypothetical protein [Actinomycetota bacterium]